MKNTILIFCTIINVIATLIALIFVFKVDVTWTGPLGDTFGGLLSPLIDGISIYFIYKTFEAQRKQLEDQKKSNEETIAIQRNQLEDQKKVNDEMIATQREQLKDQVAANRVTMGTLHLEKIEWIISDIDFQNQNYKYHSEIGELAIKSFYQYYQGNNKLYELWDNDEDSLLNRILEQAIQLKSLINLYFNIKNDINLDDQLIAEHKIFTCFNRTGPMIISIHDILKNELKHIPNSDVILEWAEKNIINNMIGKTYTLTDIFNVFVERKYCSIQKIISIDSIELMYSPDSVDSDPWNPVVDRARLSQMNLDCTYRIS